MTLSVSHKAHDEFDQATLPGVVVIVVGFHNAADIVSCLRALSRARRGPRFDVFISENGGPEAVAALLDALLGPASPCRQLRDGRNFIGRSPALADVRFSLPREDSGNDAIVRVAQMPENLGYAGGINAWLRLLRDLPGWQAVWILNPDTEPTPTALFELASHASKHKRGMVGSRIVSAVWPDGARTCGLSRRKITSRTVAVNHAVLAAFASDPDNVEAQLDAPDGASIYVTRSLIERIGLMDERYFLYYEDLEWGFRAKRLKQLGYAHRSVVPHKGGTTIGSSPSRAGRSRLAVYMEFRNRIVFARHRHGAWLAWAILMQVAHIATYLFAGSLSNMVAAGRGTLAGLRGETGNPAHVLRVHAAQFAESLPLTAFQGSRTALWFRGSRHAEKEPAFWADLARSLVQASLYFNFI